MAGRHIPHKWRAVMLFWLVYFFNQADRQVLFSVFPLIKTDLGLSDPELGLLGSVFFWVYAALVPVAGTLGDVWSRKKIIASALLLWSLATFSSGLAVSFALLVVLRAITGAGEAFYYPSANSIISDYHGQETRALAMGIHQTSLYVGIVVSGALAGYIGQRFGWRWSFLVFGGVGIVLAVVVWRALKEPARGLSDGLGTQVLTLPLKQRIADSFRTPTALLLMGAFICMKLVDAAYLAWMPTLLYRKFGLSLALAGFHATFWHHVGAAAGVLIGGRMADRWAVRSKLSRPLIQVLGLMLGAPFVFLLGWSHDQTVVYTALAMFGIFRGFYDSNLFASLYEVVRPEGRATATGAMLCIAFFAGGMAPLVIGWLSRHLSLDLALAYTSTFYAAGGLLIIADCLFFFHKDVQKVFAHENR